MNIHTLLLVVCIVHIINIQLLLSYEVNIESWFFRGRWKTTSRRL